MRTRSDELRARHRKVSAWSFLIAALVYAAVLFVWAPQWRAERLDSKEIRLVASERVVESPMAVEVLFGPPEIFTSDGSVWQEPPDRVLEARRILELPDDCADLVLAGREPMSGLVRLRVPVDGRVDRVELTQTTGDACGDRVILAVADALLYRWLPNDQFPAPVDLIQPITLREMRN